MDYKTLCLYEMLVYDLLDRPQKKSSKTKHIVV